MGLADIFRPKWKHSDVAVRAAAVRQLDALEVDVLTSVAREDDEPSIRRIALKRIEDPLLLTELAANESDPGLRDLARERADSLRATIALSEDEAASLAAVEALTEQQTLGDVAKTAALEGTRRAALDRIDDDKVLADVARRARQMSTAVEAVRRIGDESLLRGIAVAGSREIGGAALERINDPSALDAIAKKAKQKSLRKRARERLSELAKSGGASDVRRQQVRNQMLRLCRIVESLSLSDWPQTAEALEDARREVDPLRDEPEIESELLARFDQACESLLARRHRVEEAEVNRRRAVEQRRQQHQVVEQLLAQAAEAKQLDVEQIEALSGRFAELSELASDEDRRRFERTIEKARERLERVERVERDIEELPEPDEIDVERLEALCFEAEDLAAAAVESGTRGWRQIERDWGKAGGRRASAELAERFATARAKVEAAEVKIAELKERKKVENERRLAELVEQSKAACAGDDLTAAERLMRRIGTALKKLGPLPSREVADTLRTALQDVKQDLYARVVELREADEWKRWSNVPKLEALCVEVEALATLEDHAEAAAGLKRLQKAWKQVGAVPHERSDQLWQRFKAAADKVRENCAEYFASLEDERTENLKKKTALCEQVEALASSSDWDTTAEAIKNLQSQWKEIGPVPREQSDEIWKRFRAACDRFFERRKTEHLSEQREQRKQALDLKRELCEKVEQVADSENWEATAEQIKVWQREWKELGPVPRKHATVLWKRFRAACDQFFGRRDAALRDQREGLAKEKEAICSELEGLVEQGTIDDAKGTLGRLRDRFEAVGRSGRSERVLQQRFDQAADALVLANAEAFAGTDLDPKANERKLQRYCQRAEELARQVVEQSEGMQVPSFGESTDDGTAANSVEAMAAKLREAFADNAFRDAIEDEVDFIGQIKQLRQSFRRIRPVTAEQREQLSERFERAYRQVLDAQKTSAPKDSAASG